MQGKRLIGLPPQKPANMAGDRQRPRIADIQGYGAFRKVPARLRIAIRIDRPALTNLKQVPVAEPGMSGGGVRFCRDGVGQQLAGRLKGASL